MVSTHSRAKAAAKIIYNEINDLQSFNTQPREGGCQIGELKKMTYEVSTHSRAKAAAIDPPSDR